MKYFLLILISLIISNNSQPKLIEAIPFLIISTIDEYINQIEYNNPEFFEKEKDFFTQIKSELNSIKNTSDLQKKVSALKIILTKLYLKAYSSSSLPEQESLLSIIEMLKSSIKNFEEQFKDLFNSTAVLPPQKEGDVPNKTSGVNDFKRETVDTWRIDITMFVILVVFVLILGCVGWYVISKKRIKQVDIEKINVSNSRNEKRNEVNGFSVMHSEPIMSNHEDTISNTEIVLDN